MNDDNAIIRSVMSCFQASEPERLEAVATLDALLAAAPALLLSQSLTVLHTANTILEEEGRQMAALLREQGTPPVCEAGCTGCCHQLVLCQPFEAENIRRYLYAKPEILDAFRAAYPYWDQATAGFRQSYLAWAENRYGQGEDSGQHALEEYTVPCPFLNVLGQCTIYAVRPYGCRTCIALDPACATPAVGRSGVLHRHYSLYTTHHSTRTAITSMLLRRLELPAQHAAMPEIIAALCLNESHTSPGV